MNQNFCKNLFSGGKSRKNGIPHVVGMYKIKPFATNDVPPSNKYHFKTICKICLKVLIKAPNNFK